MAQSQPVEQQGRRGRSAPHHCLVQRAAEFPALRPSRSAGRPSAPGDSGARLQAESLRPYPAHRSSRPRASSSFATSAWPFTAAACRGVTPFCGFARFGSPPLAISSSTMAVSPRHAASSIGRRAARLAGVHVSLRARSALARSARRPRRAARCRGVRPLGANSPGRHARAGPRPLRSGSSAPRNRAASIALRNAAH